MKEAPHPAFIQNIKQIFSSLFSSSLDQQNAAYEGNGQPDLLVRR